jgi:hypothetical protein
VDDVLCRLLNAHFQPQNYADDVVLLQKDRVVRVPTTTSRTSVQRVEDATELRMAGSGKIS